MAQPEYVPVVTRDNIRVGEHIRPIAPRPDRPGELRPQGGQPVGRKFGIAGPDQGYALKLASHLRDRIVLAAHEHVEDAIAGCVEVAMRRAALYGRAPVIHDVELSFALWGYFAGAPDDLVAFRKPLFDGAAHDYQTRRAIIDRVPEATLRMTPGDVAVRLAGGGWRLLLGLEDGT